MTEYLCAHCGTTFTGRKRKYCTNKCLRRAQTLKQNAQRKADGYSYRNKDEGACAVCGVAFLGRTGTEAKYCSKTCSISIATQHSTVNRPQLKQCQWCNALHTKATKFCSTDCRTTAANTAALSQRSELRTAVEDGDYKAVLDLVLKRTRHTPTGCREWTGRQHSTGYAEVRLGRSSYLVHRLVLEAKHQAPLGTQAAHHKCANIMCVNPDHLQPVTHRDNIAEMLARRSYLSRIQALEDALRMSAPDHPLLDHIAVA